MKVLHIDSNHPLLLTQLKANGFENHEDYTSSRSELLNKIHAYDGLIIRSRIRLDEDFLSHASQLKFIGRVGAGLENIDEAYAAENKIMLFNAPEGNQNAVGEHALGMLLSLFNKLRTAHDEVCNGIWLREENRGEELEGKTVGILGYGNMGKSLAKKLVGFDCKVICHDVLPNLGDQFAIQVSLEEFYMQTQVLSLHTPQNHSSEDWLNKQRIANFKHPFWLLNTARGSAVNTKDLVDGLRSGKVRGAGLDVLSYEKASFENIFEEQQLPETFFYLTKAANVLLSPHIAGWTIESKQKLAQTIVDKITTHFPFN